MHIPKLEYVKNDDQVKAEMATVGTAEASEFLGVSQATVIYWCRSGILRTLIHLPNKRYEILSVDLVKLDNEIRKALNNKETATAVRSQWLRIRKRLG